MPYGIEKTGGGEKVVNKDTGHTFAKHAQTHAKALAQLRALEIHTHEEQGEGIPVERVEYADCDGGKEPCGTAMMPMPPTQPPTQYAKDFPMSEEEAMKGDWTDARKLVGPHGTRQQYEMAVQVCRAKRKNGKV